MLYSAIFGLGSWSLDAHEISTAFYLGPGTATTPYTQYILPMTQNVSSVRYVVAATASCHIGNKMQDDALKTQSLQLRVEATEALRRQLGNGRQEPDISGLACILFLAQLDVCSLGLPLQYHANRSDSYVPAAAWSLKRI